MKRPHISFSSTRARIITIVLVLLAVLTVSVVAVYYQGSHAYSGASASGNFSIIWGDPYKPAKISLGTGSESFTINGNVAKWGNETGYYTYTNFILQGRLHGAWSSAGSTYVLDANLTLETYETPYMKIIIAPSANSFIVSYMDYSASLAVNGLTQHIGGVAGMKAAAPGYFAFQGQDRSTTFIVYAPSLGYPQFVLQWSHSSQTVNGIQLPAADQFSQTVTMT